MSLIIIIDVDKVVLCVIVFGIDKFIHIQQVGFKMIIESNNLIYVDKDVIECIIPFGVRGIYYGAFSGCSLLENIIIPNGAINIMGNSFSGCCNLKSITIPDSVEYIGFNCFLGCNSLRKVFCNKKEFRTYFNHEVEFLSF